MTFALSDMSEERQVRSFSYSVPVLLLVSVL
jgi:hypothetical protein